MLKLGSLLFNMYIFTIVSISFHQHYGAFCFMNLTCSLASPVCVTHDLFNNRNCDFSLHFFRSCLAFFRIHSPSIRFVLNTRTSIGRSVFHLQQLPLLLYGQSSELLHFCTPCKSG